VTSADWAAVAVSAAQNAEISDQDDVLFLSPAPEPAAEASPRRAGSPAAGVIRAAMPMLHAYVACSSSLLYRL
jgi:hypothetical protein